MINFVKEMQNESLGIIEKNDGNTDYPSPRPLHSEIVALLTNTFNT